MSSESTVAFKWGYNLLTIGGIQTVLANPVNGLSSSIYSNVAPNGAPRPCIVMQEIASQDQYIQDWDIWGTIVQLQVKVITVGSRDQTAGDIAATIHSLLHKTSSTNFNGYRVTCFRRSIIPIMPIVELGKQYRQAGGRYNVILRPLS